MSHTFTNNQSTLSIQPSQPNTSQRKYGHAIRAISTNQMDESLWLKYRNQGIGSSDAATACGLNPYKSQLELWMEKTGRIKPTVSDLSEDSPLTWGTILEPIVAENYAKRTGHKVRRVNSILQHGSHPWMLANLDREIVGNDEVQILECKTAGVHSAKFWGNGVPEYIQLQVQHQLAVTGQQAADVAVLIGGQKLDIHRIERDESLIHQLIKLEAAFWQRVQTDTPPPVDASSSSANALRQLYPHDNNEQIDLSEDNEANQSFEELLQVRDQLAKLSEKESLLKHQLQAKMGDNSLALLASGKLSWRQAKPSTVLDSKRLKTEKPDVFNQFSKIRLGSRRFLIQPN
ncbi:lambda-exonuclease family protein [Thiomicrorhabdus indica]|uniref:YqaJ viral recombinase family nuclease n=1 Tax=Thiomicrorhabdus indica TaxID=2267253 RepID=UPI002AA8A948|nr:YqaJ viral recombinase family protein [Thiomicrorhabdus indica]